MEIGLSLCSAAFDKAVFLFITFQLFLPKLIPFGSFHDSHFLLQVHMTKTCIKIIIKLMTVEMTDLLSQLHHQHNKIILINSE